MYKYLRKVRLRNLLIQNIERTKEYTVSRDFGKGAPVSHDGPRRTDERPRHRRRPQRHPRQRHLSNRSTRSSSTCRPGREQQPDDVVAVGAGDRERVDAAAERLIDAATN